MKAALLLAFCAFATACVHKNEKYKDGDTWVVRSTFVMVCKIKPDGSWYTKVVGCKTQSGIVVYPGQVLTEADTTYECTAMRDGRVEIKRTHKNTRKQMSCEGHPLGESWVSQHNFRKTCTEDGAQITECVTDAGISVPFGQNLVLSGITYTCTRYPNGTVTINREGTPLPHSFKSNLLQPEAVSEGKPTSAVPSAIVSERKPANSAQLPVTCVSNGVVYRPEDTWISENKFTKKCTSDGSIIILNCLMDDKTTINVNTQLKLGNKTYKCYRDKVEGRVYFEVRSE